MYGAGLRTVLNFSRGLVFGQLAPWGSRPSGLPGSAVNRVQPSAPAPINLPRGKSVPVKTYSRHGAVTTGGPPRGCGSRPRPGGLRGPPCLAGAPPGSACYIKWAPGSPSTYAPYPAARAAPNAGASSRTVHHQVGRPTQTVPLNSQPVRRLASTNRP